MIDTNLKFIFRPKDHSNGLSVAASVVGIAATALQSVQFLSRTIDNIKDVPDAVKSIRVDLQAVEPVLRHLDTALQGDVSQIVLSDEVKFVVENCARALWWGGYHPLVRTEGHTR